MTLPPRAVTTRDAARGEIGLGEGARDDFRRRLGGGVGVLAAERVVLGEGRPRSRLS